MALANYPSCARMALCVATTLHLHPANPWTTWTTLSGPHLYHHGAIGVRRSRLTKACLGVKSMDMQVLRHGEGNGRPVNHPMAPIVV